MTTNEKTLREIFATETAPVRRKDINAKAFALGMSLYEVEKFVKTLTSAGKRGLWYFNAPKTTPSPVSAEKASRSSNWRLLFHLLLMTKFTFHLLTQLMLSGVSIKLC